MKFKIVATLFMFLLAGLLIAGVIQPVEVCAFTAGWCAALIAVTVDARRG